MINKINLALTALAFLVLVIYLEDKTSTEKFEIKSPYYMADLDTYTKLIKSQNDKLNCALNAKDFSKEREKSYQKIQTNIVGTFSLLEAARQHDKLLVHVSTDEVYGDAEEKESFDEHDLLTPSNPYSATKASADQLVLSYYRTYGTKCVITRCSNNFGPYQYPEKLIPKTIILALKNKKIPLHGGGSQLRNWIYVLDHISAIEQLVTKCRFGEIYNISANTEFSVRDIVEKILTILDKPLELMKDVDDRPGQDKKYSINSHKIQTEIGWKPKFSFDDTLRETVFWYRDNPNWWSSIINDKILHPQQWTVNWKH